MYERVAEIKTMVSKKEFEKVIELLLFKKRNIYSFEKKDQVVYFADTKTCELYKKSPLLLRYRRNNELLETTLKISGLTSPQIEKIITKYGQLPNHEIKCEIDQVPNGKATVSVGIKHLQANIFQAFSFTNKPKDFLSEAQQKLFDKFSSVDCNDLKFTIPIQSKAFKFRTGYKEFESLTLEEWKIPHLFGGKLFEMSAKTTEFSNKTSKHFEDMLENLNVHVYEQGKFKRERFYESYFGV